MILYSPFTFVICLCRLDFDISLLFLLTYLNSLRSPPVLGFNVSVAVTSETVRQVSSRLSTLTLQTFVFSRQSSNEPVMSPFVPCSGNLRPSVYVIREFKPNSKFKGTFRKIKVGTLTIVTLWNKTPLVTTSRDRNEEGQVLCRTHSDWCRRYLSISWMDDLLKFLRSNCQIQVKRLFRPFKRIQKHLVDTLHKIKS